MKTELKINEVIIDTLLYLKSYPLEKKVWSEGTPDWLTEEMYPGKDFVVGMCEEQIESFTKTYSKAEVKEAKDIARLCIDEFKKVLKERLEKLSRT